MIELIIKAFEWIRQKIRQILKAVFNFLLDCIQWFEQFNLKDEEVPFLADAEKFQNMLGQAPERDFGIFEGIYNSATGEIVAQKYVSADSVDEETRNTMQGEDLVILE